MPEQYINFTEPCLCHYDYDMTEAWFIYFDITNELTGVTLRKQFRGGINYYKKKVDRLREGNALCEMWKNKLEMGRYNPFKVGRLATPIAIPGDITKALDTIIELKKATLKKKSIRNYTDIRNMFVTWLIDNSLHKIKLYQFTDQFAQAYLDYLLLDRNYSGKSHNNQLGILKSFFNVMKQSGRKWITVNPFEEFKELPADVGNNLAYSVEEARELLQYFRGADKRMYYIVHFTLHAFIRKTELCEIKVGDIDWTNRTIRLRAGETKNRKQESVTIPDQLLEIIREMGLDLAPPNFYIFGRSLQTCEHRCPRPDDISDRHLQLKKKAGLWKDDGKAYYSWKHTGVVAYWNKLKDPYALMRQCRHSDLQTTMIYLKSLGLMPNEPFVGARISF